MLRVLGTAAVTTVVLTVAASLPVRAQAVTHRAYPGRLVQLNDPADPADDVVTKTGSRPSLLAFLDQAADGDRVELFDQVQQVSIGVGNPNARWTVRRRQPLRNVTIRGGMIQLLEIGGRDFVDGLRFEMTTFDGVGQRSVIAFMNSFGGLLEFIDCDWRTYPGTKWGVRGHGSYSWRFVGCRFPDGGQEHAIYVDNVQGFEAVDCTARGWKRTMIQLVVRTYPHHRPSKGDVLISRCRAYDCGAHGAGAFTIAGHVGGSVRIEECFVDSPHDTSAIVCYLDKKQKELEDPTAPVNQRKVVGPGFVNPNGFAIDHLIVERCRFFLPSTKRNVMAIASCEQVDIVWDGSEDGRIASSKPALHLAYNGQRNGEVRLQGKDLPATWDWETPSKFMRNGTPIDPTALWHALEQAPPEDTSGE